MTLLVGNNVVNVAISSILTVLLAERFSGGVAVALTTVVAGSVVLVVGEIPPKAYGLGHAEEWALTTARPVWVVFDFVTRRARAMMGADPDIEEPYTDTDPARAGRDRGEGAK